MQAHDASARSSDAERNRTYGCHAAPVSRCVTSRQTAHPFPHHSSRFEIHALEFQYWPDPDGRVVGPVGAGFDYPTRYGRRKILELGKFAHDEGRGDFHVDSPVSAFSKMLDYKPAIPYGPSFVPAHCLGAPRPRFRSMPWIRALPLNRSHRRMSIGPGLRYPYPLSRFHETTAARNSGKYSSKSSIKTGSCAPTITSSSCARCANRKRSRM